MRQLSREHRLAVLIGPAKPSGSAKGKCDKDGVPSINQVNRGAGSAPGSERGPADDAWNPTMRTPGILATAALAFQVAAAQAQKAALNAGAASRNYDPLSGPSTHATARQMTKLLLAATKNSADLALAEVQGADLMKLPQKATLARCCTVARVRTVPARLLEDGFGLVAKRPFASEIANDAVATIARALDPECVSDSTIRQL